MEKESWLRIVLWAFELTSVDLDAIDGVFFEHHPLKQNVKNGDGDILPENNYVLHFIVLCHCLKVVLNEVIYVLAKYIHACRPQYLSIVLLINNELQEED